MSYEQRLQLQRKRNYEQSCADSEPLTFKEVRPDMSTQKYDKYLRDKANNNPGGFDKNGVDDYGDVLYRPKNKKEERLYKELTNMGYDIGIYIGHDFANYIYTTSGKNLGEVGLNSDDIKGKVPQKAYSIIHKLVG